MTLRTSSVSGNQEMYLFFTVGAEGEQGHRTVRSAAAGPWRHAVLGGLAGALAAGFTTQCAGQVLPHLLPLILLDVVLGWTLQVGLHLCEQDINITLPPFLIKLGTCFLYSGVKCHKQG